MESDDSVDNMAQGAGFVQPWTSLYGQRCARVLDLGAATDSRRSRAAGAAAADAAQLDHDGDTVSGSPCSPAATEDDCGA